MREKKETIRKHYDADPLKEWNRLQKRTPYEKYITTHMMDRYIRPGSRILDIGGGPGQSPAVRRKDHSRAGRRDGSFPVF